MNWTEEKLNELSNNCDKFKKGFPNIKEVFNQLLNSINNIKERTLKINYIKSETDLYSYSEHPNKESKNIPQKEQICTKWNLNESAPIDVKQAEDTDISNIPIKTIRISNNSVEPIQKISLVKTKDLNKVKKQRNRSKSEDSYIKEGSTQHSRRQRLFSQSIFLKEYLDKETNILSELDLKILDLIKNNKINCLRKNSRFRFVKNEEANSPILKEPSLIFSYLDVNKKDEDKYVKKDKKIYYNIFDMKVD